MSENSRGELPVGGVFDSREVVHPYVRNAPGVQGSDLDVLGVHKQEPFSLLAHHSGGLGREVCEHTDDKLAVLME